MIVPLYHWNATAAIGVSQPHAVRAPLRTVKPASQVMAASDSKLENIAVIGSGPTGIYTLAGLMRSDKYLNITIFEAEEIAGKGMPYHPALNDAAMLSNIASIEIPPVQETLEAWLSRQSDETLARMSVDRERIDERTFYPRVVLGDYFQDQLKGLLDLADRRGHP